MRGIYALALLGAACGGSQAPPDDTQGDVPRAVTPRPDRATRPTARRPAGSPTARAFGQDFEGPRDGHEEGQPIHYDLHTWLFKDNPSGMFAA
jgi:hypothetical protein